MNSLFFAVVILSATCLLSKAVVHAKKHHVKQSNEAHDPPSDSALGNLRSRSKGKLNNVVSMASGRDVVEEPRHLVIGGTEIQQNDYPYLAYLNITLSDGNMTSCGGTLIDPNWILTAASCVDTAVNITAWLGVHDISTIGSNVTADSGVERHSINKNDVHIYPQYDARNFDGNFALIYFQNASNKTLPIVNFNISQPAAKEEVWTAGWGNLDYYYYSFVPLETSLEVVEQKFCKLTYSDFVWGTNTITNDMLCATGYGDKGTCYGDDGGPLLIKDPNGDKSKDILVGVTSWWSNEGCDTANRPNVFGRISAAYVWIKTTTGNY